MQISSILTVFTMISTKVSIAFTFTGKFISTRSRETAITIFSPGTSLCKFRITSYYIDPYVGSSHLFNIKAGNSVSNMKGFIKTYLLFVTKYKM